MMALLSSATLLKAPRRMRFRVISAKKRSTMLSQDAEVGVKCKWKRGCAWDRLATTRSRRSRLRNEVLKIIKEPRLKVWHTVRMMAALFVLDNLKMGVGRQQTDGVFIPKSSSEP